ncbi:MAG: hypothetical protein H6760_04305 [Candidatus Nomurabacteria bacterium]|nr:MAG: hypothetical protein H6760_04305 [Candidatus Nomurabacteria bacterium]
MQKRLARISGLTLLALLVPSFVFAKATLFFSPARSNVTVGQRVTVTLVVNSGGEAVNSAEARIDFPKDLVTLESVDRGSLFTLWPIGPVYDNGSGTIDFTGGLPTPGYAGPAGTILRAVFKAKQPGTAVISMEGARVLLNDGYGTDALGSTGTAILVISAPPPSRPSTEPEQPEEEPPQPQPLPAPTVWSDTHTNQDSWYANADPLLSWSVDGEAQDFSYLLDQSAGTIPNDDGQGTELSVQYQDKEDGIWYFHIKAKNEAGWSEATHFRVRIDTTPPLPFSVRVEGDQPTTNLRPNIDFSTEDALSGIDRYEVLIDDVQRIIALPGATEPFLLPELSYGTHTITILAIDNAGNIRSSSVSVEVVKYAPESGFWFAGIFWLYSWIAIGILVLGLLVLLLILLLMFWRRKCDCCCCQNGCSKKCCTEDKASVSAKTIPSNRL